MVPDTFSLENYSWLLDIFFADTKTLQTSARFYFCIFALNSFTRLYYWIFFHAVKSLFPLDKSSLILENLSIKFIIELYTLLYLFVIIFFFCSDLVHCLRSVCTIAIRTENGENSIKVISTMTILTTSNHFCYFDRFTVRPTQTFQVQSKYH